MASPTHTAHAHPRRTHWEERYDPAHTPVHIASAKELADADVNIGCSYNDTGEMHMIVKAAPQPKEGEVLVHVKATGICG